MGRSQARRLKPSLEALEAREVLSATPTVHAAIARIAIPISTYNNTFTQIQNAFHAYEGPYDDTINAIGSLVSDLISPSSSTDPNTDSSQSDYVSGGKWDGGALESRLQTAISKLPGGQAEAASLENRTFQLGGLTPNDAQFFQSKLDSMVKNYISQGIKRGQFVLVWPGQHGSSH